LRFSSWCAPCPGGIVVPSSTALPSRRCRRAPAIVKPSS